MDAIVEAVGSPEFVAGLRWGGVTGAVGLLVGFAWRRWRKQPAPIAGLAAVVAGTWAMSITHPLETIGGVGIGLLALAGVVFSLSRRVPFLPIFVALPGAWLIGRSGLPGPDWVVPLVVVVGAIAAPVTAWFDNDARESPLPAWMFALWAAGVWLTVPDTEEALVLLGAMVVPTLLVWPLRVSRLGPIGSQALVGVFLWVIAWGGREREGSIVGAAAAFGLLTAPIAAWLAGRPRVTTRDVIGFSLIAGHALLVLFVTRVAGLEPEARPAALLAVSAVVIALMLWFVVERSVARESG